MAGHSDGEGRTVRVSAVQLPPASGETEDNLKTIRRLVERTREHRPDFILLSELATTPYFGGHHNPVHLNWAEPIPGPSTEAVGELAKSLETAILLPRCEKSGDRYYNSVVLLSPEGEIVEGNPDQRGNGLLLPEDPPRGTWKRRAFRRAFYFTAGNGLPVFHTPKATVGVLICYDRCFPEAWRSLAIQGAEIVFVPSCIPAWYPEREDQTLWELRTRRPGKSALRGRDQQSRDGRAR